jgi:hypothetical protein
MALNAKGREMLGTFRRHYGADEGARYFDSLVKSGTLTGVEDEATVGVQVEDERIIVVRESSSPRPQPDRIARPASDPEVRRATGDARLRTMNENARQFWDKRIRAGKWD